MGRRKPTTTPVEKRSREVKQAQDDGELTPTSTKVGRQPDGSWIQPPRFSKADIARLKKEGRVGYRNINGLRPWPKGVSGNPAGRPKRKTFTEVMHDLMERALEQGEGLTLLQHFALVMLDEAMHNRDAKFCEMILDRIDPKPKSEAQDDDDGPKRIQLPLPLPNTTQAKKRGKRAKKQ